MAKVHITIPVSEAQREMLVQLAHENSMSLAAFCRDRIMARENLADEFAALQRTVIAAIGDAMQQLPSPAVQVPDEGQKVRGGSEGTSPLVAEVLLLLRSMVPPNKVQVVHGELKRLGMEPFNKTDGGHGQDRTQ